MILSLWRRPFAVLLYHDVSDARSPWAVSPRLFESQLDALTEAGCAFVTMDQVSEAVRGGPRLPHRAVCLHFDDARSGFWGAALPALLARRIPVTLFVPSAWPGARELAAGEEYGTVMSWEEVREAAAEPLVEIGCHGRTHRNLKRLPRRELGAEVGGAKAELESELGREVRHFAPPYNRVDAWVRRTVRGAGFRTLSVGGGGFNGRFTGAFRVRRFLVRRETPMAALLALTGRVGSRAVPSSVA